MSSYPQFSYSKNWLSSATIMLLLSSVMLVTGAGSAYAQATRPAKYFAVYYTITSAEATYVHVEGRTYKIAEGGGVSICYIPDLNVTTFVEGSEYVSNTWSPTAIEMYTVDNRLFLIYRNLPTSPVPGQEDTSFTELNPANCTTETPTQGWGNSPKFNCYVPTSFAVVNDRLYFQAGSWYDVLHGDWVGNDFYVVNLASGSQKQLLKANDPDNYGQLVSAGGKLFRYEFDNQARPLYAQNLTINQIDLDTGKIAKGVQLSLPERAPSINATYSEWSFAADKNAFYVAAMCSPSSNSESSQVWLCAIPLTEFENNNIPNGPDYWFNANAVLLGEGVQLWSTDACEGHVLLSMGNFAILYDSNTETYITIPDAKANAHILYSATNPEPILSPSPSPPTPPPPNETLIWVAIGVIVIASVAGVALFVRRRKGR